ncbi:hypothetical protein Dimus_010934 [Dionaea muscipula]
MQTELNEARLRLAQMKGKREMLEVRLPHQLEYVKKEAIREFMSSVEFKKMAGQLMVPYLLHGHKMGIAQVRRILEDDDELLIR